jgi:hypothetical protein
MSPDQYPQGTSIQPDTRVVYGVGPLHIKGEVDTLQRRPSRHSPANMQINIFTVLAAVAYAANQINAQPPGSFEFCICETNGVQDVAATDACCHGIFSGNVCLATLVCILCIGHSLPVRAAFSRQTRLKVTLRAATQWARAARVGSRGEYYWGGGGRVPSTCAGGLIRLFDAALGSEQGLGENYNHIALGGKTCI